MLIKHEAEDFIVEEVPSKEWNTDNKDNANNKYVIFKLTKTNLNTEQALNIITKKFHLIPETIKYSGTKDKHAKTTQYVSIPNRAGISQIKVNEENILLEHVGYNDEPLSLGTLKGNKFSITLRELNQTEINLLKTTQTQIISNQIEPGQKNILIPNYFDEQRFSSNNYTIGLNILKKDYKNVVKELCENNEPYSIKSKEYLDKNPNDYIGTLKFIPKKTLLMFIHAVQSYFFNTTLSNILLANAKEKDIKYVTVAYSLGELIFYENNSDYESIQKEISEIALIGFNSLDINIHIKKLLSELNLTSRDFIIRAIPELSVEGTMRDIIIPIKYLAIQVDETNNTANLNFELTKGSYATIVIKALTNN